jgi:tRNA threonylcarbamoyladenosine biosynthesis protein TsaB
MRLLAVETSTRTGALALVDGGRVCAESRLDVAATHGERLLPAIDALLGAAGASLAGVDGFAVALGPGSFTGLRIGVATVKGLAFATGRPVVGIPTLDALAWSLPFAANPVCPVLDARKGEVYTALYRTAEGRLEVLAPARAVAPGMLARDLDGAHPGPVIFVGDGVWTYGGLLAEHLGARARLAPPGLRLPSAASLADLGLAALAAGVRHDPASLVPIYVRPSEAELARTGRGGATAAH